MLDRLPGLFCIEPRGEHVATKTKKPAAPAVRQSAGLNPAEWFDFEGEPMRRLELPDASGRSVPVPFHENRARFDPELQRWQQLPPGVILAHACALSCWWLVSELADIWPHGDAPGNADRTWRDALSAACALRHVLDVCNRDTRRQRRAQAARRSGWAIDDRNPDLHPATDFEAFDGAPVAPPLQRANVAGEPLECDALREHQPSYHRAVLVVAADALHLVDIAFDRAELFAGLTFEGRNEGWRRAVERCGSDGPDRLRQAWKLSPEIIAGSIGTWQRPSIWPRDYWLQWHGIRALLEAEMTRVAPAVARVEQTKPKPPLRVGSMPARVLVTLLQHGPQHRAVLRRGVRKNDIPTLDNLLIPAGTLRKQGLLEELRDLRLSLTPKGRDEAKLQTEAGTETIPLE